MRKIIKDIRLLNKSIEHHHEYMTFELNDFTEENTPDVDNCPLCLEYWGRQKICNGCPIAEKTSEDSCDGTPYLKEAQAYGSIKRGGRAIKTFRKAVSKEMDFLIDLRDELEAKK